MMRLLNDRRSGDQKFSETNLFAVFLYSFYSALGIITIFFGPLPMILAHIRLGPPWPKVTALFGAVLALTIFGVPLMPVMMVFIFGLFVADSSTNRRGFGGLLLRSGVLASIIGGISLFAMSTINQQDVWTYWVGLVDWVLEHLRTAVKVDSDSQWDSVRAVLLYEGPFLFLCGAIMSLWLSVGSAAHFGWFENNHPLSSGNLRKIRFPMWASPVFVSLFLAELTGVLGHGNPLSGFYRIASLLMFIQGCVCLSEILELRRFQLRVRTLVFTLAILLGFYAVVGLGVITPWLFKSRRFETLHAER